MAEELRLNAGDEIVAQGSKPDGFFVLKQGSVGVYMEDVLIQVFNAKDTVIGEMAMILDRPRTATVKARTPCKLIKYEGSVCDTIVEHPDVGQMVLQSLADRLDLANHKIMDLTQEVREKVWSD